MVIVHKHLLEMEISNIFSEGMPITCSRSGRIFILIGNIHVHFYCTSHVLFFFINRQRNVTLLTNVVQHCTNVDYLAGLIWFETHFTVKHVKSTLELPNASLHNTACRLMCSAKKCYIVNTKAEMQAQILVL